MESTSGGGGFEERWVGLAEIAERLGKSERTISNWEKAGAIRLRRLGVGGRCVGMMESEFRSFMRGGAGASEGDRA